MMIERVSYQKTFNLGNYSSERIGVDIVLNEGEDAKLALSEASKLVHEYHKESAAQNPTQSTVDIVPEIRLDKQSLASSLIRDINSCTELKVLESYRLIVKGKPELQTAYDTKLNQLKNLSDGNNL